MSLETVERLRLEATSEAAGQLRDIAEADADKPTRRAAKRALYLLSEKGITPTATVAPSVPAGQSADLPPFRTYVSGFDGAGNMVLMFVVPDKDGGSPRFTEMLVNDETGIHGFGGHRVSKSEAARRLREIETHVDEGVAFAEIASDDAARLFAAAQELHGRIQGLLPPGCHQWAEEMNFSPQTEENAAIALTAPEIDVEPTVDEADARRLLEMPWFEAWLLAEEDAEELFYRWVHSGTLESKPEREVAIAAMQEIAKDLLEELVPPDLRLLYARRLEHTAFILSKCDRMDAARLALAHARGLESDTPTRELPLFLFISENSALTRGRELHSEHLRNKEAAALEIPPREILPQEF